MSEEIAILLTCYNRRKTTISCLESLFRQRINKNIMLQVYLVDDGSSDGTSELVRERFPQVNILNGDGNLFWGGGMRIAFEVAMKKGFAYYLWLNDDVNLYDNAIDNLLNTYFFVTKEGNDKVIIIGATQDPVTKIVTYSGKKSRSRLLPLSLRNIEPKGKPIPCDTFNGNCVLIPNRVAMILGNMDRSFPEAGGDYDYGFRARKSGCTLWLAPEYIGTCKRNSVEGTWLDKKLSLPERIRLIPSFTKGEPPFQIKALAKRHCGPLWFIHWLIWYRRVL
jgi:GT2 family glycosyltransferase